MKSRKVLLAVFFILCLAQIYVPAKMILDREGVLKSGTEYKFVTAPIDPNDPFRGKYIDLTFEQNSFVSSGGMIWENDAPIYLYLTKDARGYAKISSISKEYDQSKQDYVIGNVWWSDSTSVTFDLPFSRFYMEESKAYDAEMEYRDSQRDTSITTYALVNVLDGEAVLKDVIIGDIPIREAVLQGRD